MLFSRSSDMSKFAATTKRKHWSKKSEKLSLFLSVACTQHQSLAFCILRVDPEIVSEYDQEIPQSQTADNPMAPRGRATQPSRDTR